MIDKAAIEILATSLFVSGLESLMVDVTPENRVSTEHHRQDLEQYIESMADLASTMNDRFQCELAKARRGLNATLTINNLPNEILVNILALTMNPLCFEYSISSEPQRYRQQRAKLELVCDKWRTTVRTSACFWEVVSSALPSKVNKRSLELSGNRLLMCKTERGTSWTRSDQFWASLEPYAGRFGTIHAFASRPILNIVCMGLEELREMKLRGDWNQANPELFVLASSLDAPWPRLIRLMLSGISLPWSRPMVANLVSLSLDYVVNLPVRVLTDILRSSPQLQNLELGAGSAVMDSAIAQTHPRISLPSLRRFNLHYLAGELFDYLLKLIEPKQLDFLSLSHKPSAGDTAFSELPYWTVAQGADLLLRSNSINIHPGGECSNEAYGFHINVPADPTMAWLAKVLDHFPPSAPPTRIRCNNFKLEELDRDLHSQLNRIDRCELVLVNQKESLEAVQYLCQPLPTGSFSFPSLTDLSINLPDEASANAVAGLLEERYREPHEVAQLKKLVYTSWTGGPVDAFDTRMTEVLKDCTIEWEPVSEWRCSYGRRMERNDAIEYSDDE